MRSCFLTGDQVTEKVVNSSLSIFTNHQIPVSLWQIDFNMDTAIKMPLRSLNPVLVRDLQEKYPAAVVSIEVEASAESATMDEGQFWNLLALLDWGRKRNEDIIAPAVEALSHFSEADIFRFDQILAEKLHALDGEAFAKPLGWGDAGGPYFSVDVFLYARCCAVANGKAFYEKVLKNPALMPMTA